MLLSAALQRPTQVEVEAGIILQQAMAPAVVAPTIVAVVASIPALLAPMILTVAL